MWTEKGIRKKKQHVDKCDLLFLYTSMDTVSGPHLNLLLVTPYPSPKPKIFWLSPSLLWQISRLIYTNSGNAILALASNAIHLLWKWQRSDRNSSGKVWEYMKLLQSDYYYSFNHKMGIGIIFFFPDVDISSCRPLQACHLSCGNLQVASWWLMTLMITTLRMPFPALLYPKMILT